MIYKTIFCRPEFSAWCCGLWNTHMCFFIRYRTEKTGEFLLDLCHLLRPGNLVQYL